MFLIIGEARCLPCRQQDCRTEASYWKFVIIVEHSKINGQKGYLTAEGDKYHQNSPRCKLVYNKSIVFGVARQQNFVADMGLLGLPNVPLLCENAMFGSAKVSRYGTSYPVLVIRAI